MAPKSLVIIPDGNRTWAKKRGEPAMAGHAQGVAIFDKIATYAFEVGVEHAALWLASGLNLQKRDSTEVSYLITLLKQELRRSIKEAESKKTRVRVCGLWRKYANDPELAELIEEVQEKTEGYAGRNLTLLFGYSGTDDLLFAVEALQKSGEKVTEESFPKNLLSAHIPDIDLIVRTKGSEPHLSDALLAWQTRNAELYFSPKLWPDFTTEDLQAAFDDYANRSRHLGA